MTPSPDVPRAATRTAMDAAAPKWAIDAALDWYLYSDARKDTSRTMVELVASHFAAAAPDQSAALLAANAELARVTEENERLKYSFARSRGTMAHYDRKVRRMVEYQEELKNALRRRRIYHRAERALADDLAKALEGFDQLIEDRAKGHVVVYSDRFLRLQPAAKAALERHRGARGT